MDPAHDFNFGRLGRAYSTYVQANYPASPVKPPHEVKKDTINPFKRQYKAAKLFLKSQCERLVTLKQKSKLFDKLKNDIEEKANEVIPNNETPFDQNGMILLLKVAITEIPLSSLKIQAIFNDDFEKTLNEHANSDEAYPKALHILQLVKNSKDKGLTPIKTAENESPNKTGDSKEAAIKKSAVRKLF